ncbi:MAG: hypothetical protein GY771_03715 [bacterium]|nr:hypothetical protein [bacterium]
MRLSQPKKNTWYISLVIGLIAVTLFVLTFFIAIPYAGIIVFVLLLIAWLLMILSTAMKGL